MIEKEFKNIVEEIKQQISSTQYEIFKNANMNLLKLYYKNHDLHSALMISFQIKS